MNIEQLSKNIKEKAKLEIHNQYGKNYVAMVLQNHLSFESINFNAFKLEDIYAVAGQLEEAITDENEYGELYFDPNHPYTMVWRIGEIMGKLQEMPKKFAPSPFPFI